MSLKESQIKKMTRANHNYSKHERQIYQEMSVWECEKTELIYKEFYWLHEVHK